MRGTGIITLKEEVNSEILTHLTALGVDVNRLMKSDDNEYLLNEISIIPDTLPDYMKNFVFVDNENNTHYTTYAGRFIRGIELPVNPVELFSCIENDIKSFNIDENYHIDVCWNDPTIEEDYAERIRGALVTFANRSLQIDNEIAKLMNV